MRAFWERDGERFQATRPPDGAQTSWALVAASHVTPGTAAASQGTCPGELYGATRRMAPPAPHQLVGAGQQLGLILFFGLGATPAGDG